MPRSGGSRPATHEIPVELLFTPKRPGGQWSDLPLARLAAPPARRAVLAAGPIRARFDPRGYFSLEEGVSSAAALFRQGLRRVPVEVAPDDLLLWLNGAELERARRALLRHRRVNRYPFTYTPVLHPAFDSFPSYRDSSFPTRLDLILGEFGSWRVRGKTILDIGSNIGFFAQHFTREGAQVTAIEPDENYVRVARALNRLFRLDYEIREETLEGCSVEPHDIGVMLSVFYPHARRAAERRAFLRKIDEVIRELIVFESGDDPRAEVDAIRKWTHFNRYRRIASTYGTGKLRELGIFYSAPRAAAGSRSPEGFRRPW